MGSERIGIKVHNINFFKCVTYLTTEKHSLLDRTRTSGQGLKLPLVIGYVFSKFSICIWKKQKHFTAWDHALRIEEDMVLTAVGYWDINFFFPNLFQMGCRVKMKGIDGAIYFGVGAFMVSYLLLIFKHKCPLCETYQGILIQILLCFKEIRIYFCSQGDLVYHWREF